MKRFEMILMVLALGAGLAFAQDVRQLTVAEASSMAGATHVVEIDYDDLTTTTTNTAQVLTVGVLSKQAVECVAAVLVTPFVDAATNGNNTLTLTVGDGTDADLYLASMELAGDGTEVYLKHGRSVWNSGSATNVTLNLGQKVYTADDTIDLTVTPDTNYAVSAMDTGRVRVYLRVLDAVARLR